MRLLLNTQCKVFKNCTTIVYETELAIGKKLSTEFGEIASEPRLKRIKEKVSSQQKRKIDELLKPIKDLFGDNKDNCIAIETIYAVIVMMEEDFKILPSQHNSTGPSLVLQQDSKIVLFVNGNAVLTVNCFLLAVKLLLCTFFNLHLKYPSKARKTLKVLAAVHQID